LVPEYRETVEMSGKPLIRPAGILAFGTAQCDRILLGSSARPRTGTRQPCLWRKSQSCRDKEYLAGGPNHKTDSTTGPRNMDPKARSMGTRTWRSKCKPKSPFYRCPCCRQFYGRANPTPATQRFLTCRCEFVPG